MPIDRITDLIDRLGAYPWWAIMLELILIWIAVYLVVRFVQGTRAASAIKSLLLIAVVVTLAVRILGDQELFGRIAYLYDRAVALLAIVLVVVFQPELRRAVIRLGESSVFGRRSTQIELTAREIARACQFLSKAQFGAILAIERSAGLRHLIEDGGTVIDGEVSARLLQTIFHPGSALHDLAVVIRSGRVAAAHVQLPLAEPEDMPSPEFGSRHRAAVGLTRDSDALVVLVSEETGHIRFAEHGKLSPPISPEELEIEIQERLGAPPEPVPPEQTTSMSDEGMVKPDGSGEPDRADQSTGAPTPANPATAKEATA
ncbi:MAG: diadenylate cyclase [Planctomycetota bacterium]